MAGTGQTYGQESATHKVASHIPGTEANRERKLAQDVGVGTGAGAYDATGFDNTQGAGALAGTGHQQGHLGQTTASHTGLAGTDYPGTGHQHNAGTGTGAGAGGLIHEATPGRIGEHGHHTATGTTGTGYSSHTSSSHTATDTATGEKQSIGTKIKKVIPGTEEHKLHKEGML